MAETGAARHTMLVRLPNALMREGDARSASARGGRRNAREARARERRAEAERTDGSIRTRRGVSPWRASVTDTAPLRSVKCGSGHVRPLCVLTSHGPLIMHEIESRIHSFTFPCIEVTAIQGQRLAATKSFGSTMTLCSVTVATHRFGRLIRQHENYSRHSALHSGGVRLSGPSPEFPASKNPCSIQGHA